MNSFNEENMLPYAFDMDNCRSSPNVSPKKLNVLKTSTPNVNYKPRVNFHSVESLALSAFDTSSVSMNSSPFSQRKYHDSGYDSIDRCEKENSGVKVAERKPRRKLTDWQIWHLRQAYANSRYPSPQEQEQLSLQLSLPLSSVRIWFQNYRARAGRK